MKEPSAPGDLHAAGQSVTDATRELASVLGEVQTRSRADKTTMSEALQKAFAKVWAAREHLVALESGGRGRDG